MNDSTYRKIINSSIELMYGSAKAMFQSIHVSSSLKKKKKKKKKKSIHVSICLFQIYLPVIQSTHVSIYTCFNLPRPAHELTWADWVTVMLWTEVCNLLINR